MKTLLVCVTVAALSSVAGCTAESSNTTSGKPSAHSDSLAHAINTLSDGYVAAYFKYYPEQATLLGAPFGDDSRVSDNSAASLAAFRAVEDSFRTRVRAIDTAGLGNRTEVITYGILAETIDNNVGLRVCRNELWKVDASPNSWQATLTEAADQQRVGNDSLRALAIKRAVDVARYIDAETPNLREGIKQGYTAPRSAVQAVLKQLDDMQSAKVDSSPFMSPANRDSSPVFRKQLADVVSNTIDPAVKRYRAFLSTEYLAKAREKVGVSANPNGADCYRASVKFSSTVDISPDSVYNLGIAVGAGLATEMKDIAKKDFATDDLKALLKDIRHNPKYAFTTRQEIRDSSRAAIDRAKAAIPKLFGIQPKATVEIREYPEFRQIGGAPGESLAPGPDGSPAIFLINTYDPTHKNRATQEALAFHEGTPGHGLQTAIAVEQKDANAIARYLYSSGFAEGWALYAEGLADETGLYSSPLGRLGMRASAAFRAARLVVDPAIHTKGWTRQQAVDYLKANTAEDDRKIEGEVDRYISWPGQATSYMLGRLEILRLRQKAKDAMGAKFDIRAFHDQVLGAGNISLPILASRVDRWIAASK